MGFTLSSNFGTQRHIYPGAVKQLGTIQSREEAENKEPEWMQGIHLFTTDAQDLCHQTQQLKFLVPVKLSALM